VPRVVPGCTVIGQFVGFITGSFPKFKWVMAKINIVGMNKGPKVENLDSN